MNEEENVETIVALELKNPSTKEKKHFKTKKKNNVTKMVAISEGEYATEIMENKLGFSDTNISQRLQSEIQAAIDETYKSFKNSMKKTVLHALGFEADSWGRDYWRIDHCNGRMSAVTDHVAHLVQSFFSEIKIEDLSKDLLPSEIKQMRTEIIKEVKQKMKYEVNHYIDRCLREMVTTEVRKVASKAIQEEIKNHEETISKAVKQQFDQVIHDKDVKK